MTTRTTTRPGTSSPATPRRTSHHTRPDVVQAGVTLCRIHDRPAKALVCAALAPLGVEPQFLLYSGDCMFRVVTACAETPAVLAEARAVLRGLLLALYPPDPLAANVTVTRSEWARFTNTQGRAVAGWTFSCGDASCITVAGVRIVDFAHASRQMITLGWRLDDNAGWLCPHHGVTVTP